MSPLQFRSLRTPAVSINLVKKPDGYDTESQSKRSGLSDDVNPLSSDVRLEEKCSLEAEEHLHDRSCVSPWDEVGAVQHVEDFGQPRRNNRIGGSVAPCTQSFNYLVSTLVLTKEQ